MASEFTILPNKTSGYVGIIVCNNFYNPTEHINDLDLELTKSKAKGRLLIDLLLVNGDGQYRFAECYFNGNHIDTNTIKTIIDVPVDIINLVTNYFYQNYYLIENSILTKSVKFKYRKKLAA